MPDDTDQIDVRPPPSPALPSGSGYTYSTPGPADWRAPVTAPGPGGVSVPLPANVQGFAAVQGAPGPSPQVQQDAAMQDWMSTVFRKLPVQEAFAAIEAANKFQGQRIYQNMLNQGKSSGEALAAAGPLLFGGVGARNNLSGLAQLIKATTPQAPKPQSPLGKLQADRALALQRGDTASVRAYDAAIQEQISNKGRSVYMGMDDQGRPIFQFTEGGAAPLKPTVAMQTQAQEKEVKYANAVELMSNLESVLKPEHVGVRGAAGEWIVDKGLQQAVEAFGMPDIASGGRMESRKLIVGLRESMMREMNNDNRFTKDDRAEIASALPSNGVFESYRDAKKGIDVVRRIVQQRSRNYATSINQPAPLWSLTSDEIVDRYKKGQISRAEAEQALMRYH